jgi:sulfoxide reductase heme-binding subunit YedZ
VLHFDGMRAGKNDFLEPRVYAGVLVVLLGLRLYWWRGRAATRKRAV